MESVRKNLLTCGTDEAVRAVLTAMASGPAPARPTQIRDFVARLSVHFWRPDFHAAESKSLNDDFQRLLAGLTADDLAAAYDAVLLNPENRYFPTPGMVRACIADRLAERARVQTGAALALELLDTSPEPEDTIDPARARQIMKEFRKAARL